MTGRRQLFAGAGWGVVAEALSAPSGLVTVVFLGRVLGADGYGQYALAVGAVVFLQGLWSPVSSRAVARIVGQARDPSASLPALLRIHVAVGLALGALVWLGADVIARGLGEPSLGRYLRVFAADLPLAAIAEAHVNSLLGLGRYRFRALTRAVRWTVRPLFIIGLVWAGYGIVGALVGAVLTTVVEILVARLAVRPRLWASSTLTVKTFASTAVPLAVATVIMSVQRRVDLFFVTALGGTAESAGYYAAAQNVALVPALLSLAAGPVFVAAVNRALRDGDDERARLTARDGLRASVLLLPMFAGVAGAGREVAALLYGGPFEPAGPVIALLVPAAAFLSLSVLQVGLLVAAGRPRLTLLLTAPALVAALIAYVALGFRYGTVGIAWGTMLGALSGVAVGVVLSRSYPLLRVPAMTAVRALGVAAVVFVAAAVWPTPGWLVVPKLCLLTLTVPVGLVALGEIDLSRAWAVFREGATESST